MTETYRQYANKIPKEIRLAVEGMQGQNELRFAIIVALLEEEELSFTDLKETLNIHQQRLSTALDSLQTGGIVKKEADGVVGGQQTGEYQTTEFGRQILDGFYSAMKPKREGAKEKPQFTTAPNVFGEEVYFGGWNVTEVNQRETVEGDPGPISTRSQGYSGTYGGQKPVMGEP